MRNVYIEFTDDTLVHTEQGVERLADLLHRPVTQCLWAICWQFKGYPNGISFHPSHSEAKKFAEMQIDSQPSGPARLVDVSDYLCNCVNEHGYCWTNLTCFDEAMTYGGEQWNH